jgi:membrane protein
MKPRDVWPLVKDAVKSWIDDRAPSMGAALSYYTVFSTAPLLLIVIGVVGLVLGGTAAQDAVVAQLQALLGEQAAAVVNEMLAHVQRPEQGAVATVVGAVALVVGATTVFAELQDDLDRIFESPARPAPNGLWGWLRVRILSLGMVLTAGFLLLVSLLISTALAAVGGWIGDGLQGWQLLAKALNFALSFGLITAMFAMLYRYLPQTRTAWRDVWFGAAITALLFNLGKYLIGLYLGRSSVTEGFGATGSLAVFLLWVYYSAQIFLLGAEFTWVLARRRSGQGAAAPAAAGAAGGAWFHRRRTEPDAARRLLHRQAGAWVPERSGAAGPAGDHLPQCLDHAAGALQRTVGARAGRGPGAGVAARAAGGGGAAAAICRPTARPPRACTTVRCSSCRRSWPSASSRRRRWRPEGGQAGSAGSRSRNAGSGTNDGSMAGTGRVTTCGNASALRSMISSRPSWCSTSAVRLSTQSPSLQYSTPSMSRISAWWMCPQTTPCAPRLRASRATATSKSSM